MISSSNSKSSEKSAARQLLLSKRLNLSELDRLAWDDQIFNRLLTLPLFKQAHKIACYFSHLNEPQLIPRILNLGNSKLFYLPILKKPHPNSGSSLVFGPCTSGTQYKNNIYDIPEPDISEELELNADELDLILMPLVGFTANKKRLGMGGGFYDKTLSFKLRTSAKKPYLVGIAYECQKLENIPSEKHDIDLDYIITESQVY